MQKMSATAIQLRFTTKVLLSVLLVSMYLPACASDLTKAFKYLNTGDYPNAQKFLLEVIADEPDNAAANFGMAKFYFLKDNKLYNLDSANTYIIKAAKKLPINPDDKQGKKYLVLGVRDYTIKSLQQDINQAAYAVAEHENTVESYQHFISSYSDSGLIDRSTGMRNQKAYIRARGKNDPWALDSFVKTYPDAVEVKEAKELFEKLLYQQTTADKTYTAYKNYLDHYPNGAYAAEARKNYETTLLQYYNNKHDLEGYKEFERLYKNHPAIASVEDSIYTLATPHGTASEYKALIQSYKGNPNAGKAWNNLYRLSTPENTETEYRAFLDTYPEFTDKQKVFNDIELSKKDLKLFKQDDKYGYALYPSTDSMKVIIALQYDEATEFKSGLAAVRNQTCSDTRCSYFYINKENQKVFGNVTFNYAGDFEDGVAIVGTGNCEVDSCKYGLINKLGNWVVKPEFDELNDPAEGLYAVSKNDRYGYMNSKGETVISLKYNNAVSFSQGAAAVEIDTNWFFIDKNGRQLFIDFFHDVSNFKDSLCAVSKDGNTWGYINMTGNFVLDPVYEDAGDFENGFAIVSKKEKDLKHKGLFISQRYKIDKKGKIIEKLLAPKDAAKKGRKKKGRN